MFKFYRFTCLAKNGETKVVAYHAPIDFNLEKALSVAAQSHGSNDPVTFDQMEEISLTDYLAFLSTQPRRIITKDQDESGFSQRSWGNELEV